MSEYVERFLARIWVSDIGLTPVLPSYTQLGQAIGRNDFAPLPFQEFIGSALAARVAITWDDGVWRLMLRSASVDLDYRHPLKADPLTFGDFLGRAALVLSGISRHFERSALRMAGLQEVLLREMEPDALRAAAARLLRTPASFQEHAAFEWDWRVASKVTRAFGNAWEEGNTIASMKRTSGQINNVPFDRLRLSTDVNTEPSNITPRFSPEQVAAFFGASREWHDALARETLDLAGVLP